MSPKARRLLSNYTNAVMRNSYGPPVRIEETDPQLTHHTKALRAYITKLEAATARLAKFYKEHP